MMIVANTWKAFIYMQADYRGGTKAMQLRDSSRSEIMRSGADSERSITWNSNSDSEVQIVEPVLW